MDSLPLEIICMIVSHLPRRRRNPGHKGREEDQLQALNEYQRVTAGLTGDELEEAVRKLIEKHTEDSRQECETSLAPFATISTKWQYAVERFLFEEIIFTNAELDDFASIFSPKQAHRRRFLEHANFRVILPEFGDPDDTWYESDKARRDNDRFASKAVWALFNILSPWKSDPSLWFELSLAIPSPKYKSRKHQYSYISIKDAENLPALPFIRELNLSHGELAPNTDNYRRLHPTTIFSLMEKAPGQEKVQWNYEPPALYLALRRQLRNAAIESLKKVKLSPAVRKISFSSMELLDKTYPHDQRLPNLIYPHKQDPLCSALHRLVDDHNICELWMEGQVEPSLFWPYPETETPAPFWQSMETFHVGCALEAPNGRWYFKASPRDLLDRELPSEEPLPVDATEQMPPGYGTADDNVRALLHRQSLRTKRKFRRMPNDKMVAPLLISFARAMSQMPLLKLAVLWNNISEETWTFKVEYRAPGYQPEYDKYMGGDVVDISKPRIFFTESSLPRGHKWRPSDDVIELFRNVSMDSHGQKAEIISWWDLENRDGDLSDEEAEFWDEDEDSDEPDYWDEFTFNEFLTDGGLLEARDFDFLVAADGVDPNEEDDDDSTGQEVDNSSEEEES
ncbi:hypothetical protein B0T21DRAFT_413694 [Apiosordaria backusii]|uniref:Uncharacterized protein n=1 Tax=Apiosordaria backusii TaxID=314023 RepID=A0AA40B2L9_9PEZI|nr:hypothetical protein B0T21DRAFT_413694 [Apiosordaria backusii]